MPVLFELAIYGFVGTLFICKGADPRCPRPFWKILLSFCGGVAGGALCKYGVLGKVALDSASLIVGSISAAAVGHFVYLIFCPIPPRTD